MFKYEWLVVLTFVKNMKVSRDYFSQMKNKEKHFQTTNQNDVLSNAPKTSPHFISNISGEQLDTPSSLQKTDRSQKSSPLDTVPQPSSESLHHKQMIMFM